MKALKWALLSLGAVVLIAVAVVAYFVATFDPNDYKPRIVELVKRQTGRTLALDGKIGLTFFPKIGAVLGKVTLSEPNRPAIFARVDEARVAVALLPLLSRHVIVDRVTLTGLAVDLVRHKDGRTNFDDLTGRAGTAGPPSEAPGRQSPGSPMVVDVGGIAIDNATIGWRDEADGTNVRLSNVALKTGRLASGVPGKLELAARIQGTQPKVNLQLDMETGYRFDLQSQAVALSSLVAKVVGDAPGVTGIDARVKGEKVDLDPKAQRVTLSGVELTAKTRDGLDAKVAIPSLALAPDRAQSQAISADVALATPPRTISVKLQIAPLAAQGKRIELSRLDVDLTAKQPDLSVQGKLATPLTIDLDKRLADLPGIAGNLTLAGKGIPDNTKAVVKGAARADWGAETANAALAVTLPDSNLDAKVAVAHWSRPAITFSVVADRLNVDRYVPPSKPAPGPAAVSGGPVIPTAGGGEPAEQPFDLSALKALDATGTVRIGALQMSNVKAEQVTLAIKAAGGKVDVNPLSANLYQGSLAGSAAVNANDNSFAVKQKLTGVSVGPLLRDVAGKDLLDGRGTVVLDVTTSGRTVTALKKALAGTASAALKDGAIKGVDIAAILRTAQTLLGSKQAFEQPAKGGAKTDFAGFTASFLIKRGVAHNDDLQVTSPVLRITGGGDVDIGDDKLDFTAKAALTAAAASLGGKDLAQLAGVPVPVRATGPLANPTYAVDVQSLATELAKGALQREIDRRIGGGKSGGQSGSDAVGDALRGLFGKPK